MGECGRGAVSRRADRLLVELAGTVVSAAKRTAGGFALRWARGLGLGPERGRRIGSIDPASGRPIAAQLLAVHALWTLFHAPTADSHLNAARGTPVVTATVGRIAARALE